MDQINDRQHILEDDDPLYSEAREEVFRERLTAARDKIGPRPRAVSQQIRAYRGDLTRMRHLAKWPTIIAIPAGLASYLFSSFSLAAVAGFVSVTGSILLGVCLLRELLNGAGSDIETQFVGPEGPFRKYRFQSSLTSTGTVFVALVTVLLGVVIGYSEIYLNLSLKHLASFSQSLDLPTSLYFSLVTFATVGYGDIAPADCASRVLVSTEIIVSLFSLAILLATSLSWILSKRQELSALRAEERELDTQNRERTLKEAGLGLYSSDSDFHVAVLRKVEELRLSRSK